MTLSNKNVRFLKSLAHHLNVIVTVGQKGVTPAVIEEINIALTAKELIKIKLPALDKSDKKTLVEEITNATDAASVQLIGRVAVIYRPSEPARISLPD